MGRHLKKLIKNYYKCHHQAFDIVMLHIYYLKNCKVEYSIALIDLISFQTILYLIIEIKIEKYLLDYF